MFLSPTLSISIVMRLNICAPLVAEVIGTVPVEEDMEREEFDDHFTIFLKTTDARVVDETMSKIAEIDRYEISTVD